MRESSEMWYLRFPDGRVVKTEGTALVRQYIASGRIPLGTHLRRSGEQEWHALSRWPEFADLLNGTTDDSVSYHSTGDRASGPATTIASRLDATRLHPLGVQGLMEELLAALDSAASSRKMLVAGLAGSGLGIFGGLAALPAITFSIRPPGNGWLLALGGLLILAWLVAVLSRLTFIELSLLRPARLREAFPGSVWIALRLLIGYLLVGAGPAVLILAGRWLPGWLLSPDVGPGGLVQSIASQAAVVVGILVEGLSLMALALLLPMGALLVIEECSLVTGVLQWFGLIRRNLGRLLLAEGLTLALALFIGSPLVLLLGLLVSAPVDARLALVTWMTRAVCFGVVGALVVGYLMVANVFIYLKMRYQNGGTR